jgi:hypothetical protein
MKLLTRSKKERYAFVFTTKEFLNLLEGEGWELNFKYKDDDVVLNSGHDTLSVQSDGSIRIEFVEEETFG